VVHHASKVIALYRLTLVLVLMACSVPAFADDCSGVGEIQGRVVDGANRPVVDVQVSAFPLECAVGALLPAPVKTSAEGTFRLNGVLAGLTAVYTSKPDSGYPDTRLAFYGVEYPPTKVVVRAGHLTSGVVIGLTTAEIVAGKILDEATSQPLLNAWVRISRVDSEDLTLSLGPDFTGGIRFLLPAAPVTILIKARGYKPWLFTGPASEVGLLVTEIGSYIALKSFGTRQLNVKLRRLQD
jgi:hypothetical protein